MNQQDLKTNLLSGPQWLRFAFMILFAGFLQIARIAMWVLVVLQFLFALITGKDNTRLRSFGGSLSEFIYQSFQYLTYNTEEKPFPFSSWPEPSSNGDEWAATTEADLSDEEKSKSTIEKADISSAVEDLVDDDDAEGESRWGKGASSR